jgi:pantoate--beta-alanine ligase
VPLERVYSQEEVRQALLPARREHKVVALVPTMGALHEGHLSLVRAACGRADVVAVSIFVNPTQFSPGEDYEKYPRTIDHDLMLLKAEGIDLVFTPSADAMYRRGMDTRVVPGSLADLWEGASRPGHFTGMTTVVAKLLNICTPDLAFFGEKDYQQLVVVRRVVRDLDVPVTVVGCPIVRERDGVAMSSRNRYLDTDERKAATVLYRALSRAEELAREGERDADVLVGAMEEAVAAEPLAELDYATVVNAETLEAVETLEGTARALIAARIGPARLIDNLVVGE